MRHLPITWSTFHFCSCTSLPTQCLPWMLEEVPFPFLSIRGETVLCLWSVSLIHEDHYTRHSWTHFNKTSSKADQKAFFPPVETIWIHLQLPDSNLLLFARPSRILLQSTLNSPRADITGSKHLRLRYGSFWLSLNLQFDVFMKWDFRQWYQDILFTRRHDPQL